MIHNFTTTAERDAWHRENVPDVVSYLDGSVPGCLLTRTDFISTYMLRVTVDPLPCECAESDSAEESTCDGGPIEVYRATWTDEYGENESHMGLCRAHAEAITQEDDPRREVERVFTEVTP